MKKKLLNRKGNVFVELIMIFVLLILFSSSIYQLIEAGKKTEEKIITRKTAQIDARIASSFINVRLRQNDVVGKIVLKNYEKTNKNAIVIEEREIENYDTWIYFANGQLYECITSAGGQPEEILSTPIAYLDNFLVSFNEKGNAIVNKIYYSYLKNGKKEIVTDVMESVVNLSSY